jgi:hypothetical protein
MKSLRNSSKLVMLGLMLVLCISGCKSRKKVSDMKAAEAEKAKIEQEARLRQQQLDEQKRKDADEQARRDAEEAKQREAKASTPAVKLGQYFDAISTSGSTSSANNTVNEALSLFASPDAPVLIIISGSGDQKDFDRPTTIKAYLNYLKDQKKNINKIEDLQFDSAGKITSVELRKN